MKGYSRSKEDYREKLVKKFFNKSFSKYSYDMKEFVLVTTKDCSKCKFIEPVCKEWCNKN
jgi:hypothetical protein